MPTLLRDIQFAWRSFRRTPGTSALALVTIAIGIGANAAIYSVIRSVLIDPLPYPDSRGLAIVWRSNPAVGGLGVSPAYEDVVRWRQARSLVGVTGFSARSLTLTGGAEPEQIVARQIEPGLFDFLGVRPALGRVFTAEDAASSGAGRVVILTDALWRRRFGRDPGIVGQPVVLSDERYQVVGVMPPGFRLPLGTEDAFVPLVTEPAAAGGGRRFYGMSVLVRVRPGVSTEAAAAELTGLMDADALKGIPGRWVAQLMEPSRLSGPAFRRALLVLLGAVGFVLLIGCANVAAISLARNAARAREIAVRVAIGAGRGRLVRQLLTESLLLAVGGGIGGIALGIWMLHGLAAIRPAQMEELAYVSLSPQMFGVAAALTLVTALLFGLAPALAATRVDLNDALRQATRSAASRRGAGVRRALTIGEVCLASLLLVGAGLLIRSYARMLATDPGFQPSGRVALHVTLPDAKYPEGAARRAFFMHWLDSARALPGVEHAALGSGVPPAGGIVFGTLEIEGQPPRNGGQPAAFSGGEVGPGYFQTLGIPIREGRGFVDTDITTSAAVVVINESAARSFYPGRSALGQRLRVGSGQWATVVGVVGDLKGNAKTYGDIAVYSPMKPDDLPGADLVVSVSGDPLRLVPSLKAQVWAIDPTLPVTKITTLDAAMAEKMSRPRFNLVLLASFAAVGLLLAAIGIYGVISASVAQRTQEIGVRMALGALPRDIRRAVVGEALVLAGIGLASGIGLALALTRVMRAMLYETSAADPAAIGGTLGVLAATALLAAWVPARRAMRVDPMVALRSE